MRMPQLFIRSKSGRNQGLIICPNRPYAILNLTLDGTTKGIENGQVTVDWIARVIEVRSVDHES